MSIATRQLQPEIMDEPDLPPARHVPALEGLARINRLSGSTRILWRPIHRFARQAGATRLRVLDIASGGGDVAINLWRRAQAAGIELDLTGCDISPTAIDHATAAAERHGAAVRFEERDVLSDPPAERFDIVTCSLFLHHLSEEDAVRLLRIMSAAGRLALVNDLLRSRLGYWLAVAGCRVLSRSDVVHTDGPRSVEGAFTIEEVDRLCEQAGVAGARIDRRFPCRFLLQWRGLLELPGQARPSAAASGAPS